ncbi:serine protease 30-like [Gigantopelta aegis]|uniref:serine protease 30-like n=1 Tax=Gigantopelta aegis TaxID=1735272 RepID=UPI001B88BC42|nr:serine protease 30-like [Gigantopelta aegis]
MSETEEDSKEAGDSRRWNLHRLYQYRPHYSQQHYTWLQQWLHNWQRHYGAVAQHHIPIWHPVGTRPRPVRPIPTEGRAREEPLDFAHFIAKWQGEVETCGQQQIQPHLRGLRIVGGLSATRGSWPWMVSLKYKPFKQHWCGGQLISNQWVLTAAHCLYAVPHPKLDIAREWTIELGRYNISAPTEATEQSFDIASMYLHSEFQLEKLLNPKPNEVPSDNDLALIKLDRPVELNKWVTPVCLPTNDMEPTARERCVILGWGATYKESHKMRLPDLLQEAVVPTYSNIRCSRFPGYKPLLTNNMLCAGYQRGSVDSCAGDSGGPLQCKHGERWFAIGSTSWGDAGSNNGCARPMRPGVYTKVANYVEWIHTILYEDYISGFDAE